LFNLYKLISEQNQSKFTTKNNIQYSCVFTQPKDLLGLNVKSEVHYFVKTNNCLEKEPLDVKVGNTVGDLLNRFLNENKTKIVYYICDDSDSKGEKRNLHFVKWFQKNNTEKDKKLIKCSIKGYIFGGIILHYSNTEIHIIQKYFEQETIQFQSLGKQTEIEVI